MKKAQKNIISSFSSIPVKSELVEVEVPEWGTKNEDGEVEPAVFLMRSISQGERRRFSSKGELNLMASMNDADRNAEIARWRDWYESGKREIEILKLCYVKEDGSQLFSDEEAHRIMEQVDARPVVRLVTKAEEHNLLTVAATEDFRKNG